MKYLIIVLFVGVGLTYGNFSRAETRAENREVNVGKIHSEKCDNPENMRTYGGLAYLCEVTTVAPPANFVRVVKPDKLATLDHAWRLDDQCEVNVQSTEVGYVIVISQTGNQARRNPLTHEKALRCIEEASKLKGWDKELVTLVSVSE